MSNSSEHFYQPPPITGYRNLSQAEVDLINKIKALGAQMAELHGEVLANIDAINVRRITEDSEAREQMMYAEPYRWLAIAKHDLQTGLMAMTRAVARPTSW